MTASSELVPGGCLSMASVASHQRAPHPRGGSTAEWRAAEFGVLSPRAWMELAAAPCDTTPPTPQPVRSASFRLDPTRQHMWASRLIC